MNPIKTVLISGASVAGPMLAFWLSRNGFAPTIVERWPSLRPGGHAVDFRGTAMEVVRRMGLADSIKAAATKTRDMRYVDARDRTQATLPAEAFGGDVEVLRGDLAEILYENTRHDCEYIFGDTIEAIDDRPDGAHVTFKSGLERTFDIVVGCDGQHSNVRAKVFGLERDFVEHLGLHVSIFTMPNRPNLDYSGHLYCAPGTLAGIYSARDNSEARALLFFAGVQPNDYDYRDVARQKQIVRERYAGQGWYVPQILADMETAPDFFFDSVCQVRMDRWSKDRVALVGDAGYCASPLSGMGTSLAAVGAFFLAEELGRCGGNHASAFARYEQRMRPFVDAAQHLATRAAGAFVPPTSFKLFLRNLMLKLLPLMPADMMTRDANAVATTVTLEA